MIYRVQSDDKLELETGKGLEREEESIPERKSEEEKPPHGLVEDDDSSSEEEEEEIAEIERYFEERDKETDNE